MELRQNISAVLNAIKVSRCQSLTEFSEELEISRSHLQELLKGKGNPRMGTIVHIAEKLDINPAALIAPSFDTSQLQIIGLLLQMNETVQSLDSEKRKTFMNLLLQMVQLWED